MFTVITKAVVGEGEASEMYSLVRTSIADCAMLVGQTQASYRIQSKFSSKHVGVYVIINFIIIVTG